MKNQTLLLCGLIFCGCLSSCSKSDNGNPSAQGITYASMDEVFSQLSVQPKVVTVNAGSANSFYGNSGTRYVFSPNSFTTAAGTPVTGNVQVSVAEYIDKGDMLFSKMLPISNNEPLYSKGEISVSAAQNGTRLYLAPYHLFRANIPTSGAVPSNLQLFMGNAATDTTEAKINWITSNPRPSSAGMTVSTDTIGIISDSLTQCNADAFLPEPINFQTFTVTIQASATELDGSAKVYAYVFYDQYIGEWPLGVIGSYSNGVFTEQHVPNIPVHIVAFTLIKGKFYGGITGATPFNGSNYKVTINAVDPATFKQQVSAL